MPNIIRIRNLQLETSITNNIVFPIDSDEYISSTGAAKQVSIAYLKTWLLSGGTSGTDGTSGINGSSGTNGTDGTSGISDTGSTTDFLILTLNGTSDLFFKNGLLTGHTDYITTSTTSTSTTSTSTTSTSTSTTTRPPTTTTTTTTSRPTITTSVYSGLTSTTATSGGNVTSSGGVTVTARGVCWSTATPPTIANSHTINVGGIGLFTSLMSGLTANTKYYYSAYATNSVGTSYGVILQLTTLPTPTTTTTTTTIPPPSGITISEGLQSGNNGIDPIILVNLFDYTTIYIPGGFNRYELYRYNGVSWTLAVTTTYQATYSISDTYSFVPGSTYSYYIRVYDNNGKYADSNIINIVAITQTPISIISSVSFIGRTGGEPDNFVSVSVSNQSYTQMHLYSLTKSVIGSDGYNNTGTVHKTNYEIGTNPNWWFWLYQVPFGSYTLDITCYDVNDNFTTSTTHWTTPN